MTLESQIYSVLDRMGDWPNLIGALETAGIFYFILLILELAFDGITGRRKDIWEPLTNISFYVATVLFERGVYGIVLFAALIVVSNFAFSDLPVSALSWMACLLGADFLYYVMHRCEHRVRVLWALHSIHHSSEEYDLSTAMRIFCWSDFFLWIFFAPLVLIGFEVAQVVICMITVFTYMTWVHTEKIGKLGRFDCLFNSPSNHRVHHGTNRQYRDKNYAGILMIWDRFFGTYQPEIEKVQYGLTHQIGTSDPIKVTLHELVLLGRDVTSEKSWLSRLSILLKYPGWKPMSHSHDQ